MVAKIEACQCVVLGDERELTEWAFDDCVSGGHTLKTRAGIRV